MKKLLFMLDTEDQGLIDQFVNAFKSEDQAIFVPDSRIKVFQIDGSSMLQIYPKGEEAERQTIEPVNISTGNAKSDRIREKIFKKAEKEKEGYKTFSNARMKYPKGLANFIKKNMDGMDNEGLCTIIKNKYNMELTKIKLSAYMVREGIKRNKKGKAFLGGYTKPKENKFIGANSNVPQLTINGVVVPEKVMRFVESKKHAESLELRDDIIEIFQINYKQSEIRAMQAEFVDKKKLPPENY